MNRLLNIVISILALWSFGAFSIAFASCPAPETLYYYCGLTKQGKSCYWATSNACFEGSAKGMGANAGDTAGPFVRAIWWPSSSDASLGTASCFYQGPHGAGVINVFQAGGYGEVPKPSGLSWHPAENPGMLSCESNDVQSCHFKYCD